MSNSIVILGAGPAGLGAAFQIARRKLAAVTVLEQRDRPGGNAGSFLLDGVNVDYGSHRLHPSCNPAILRDLSELLGANLLDRPRHGRIRLSGRWIHFPLKPLDLALHLPPEFAYQVMMDSLAKPFRREAAGPASFATVLEAGLGPAICREFYFPFARKIWGARPEELSAIQAQRRVSGNSPARMLRKILASVPGLRPPGAGRFFYPRQGYGQISDRLAEAGCDHGASILFGCRVTKIDYSGGANPQVWFERGGGPEKIEASQVWSTLPINLLAKSLEPVPPRDVLEAANGLAFRAMLLIYLTVEQRQYSEYDAHYFPEERIPISRLSEPKNYSAVEEPRDRTVLCAELPCQVGSPHWGMTDDQLGQLVSNALRDAEIPIQARISRVTIRRLAHAYPLYIAGYEDKFLRLEEGLQKIPRLLTFGRQGLFAHDNTHHALYMAYCAVDCLSASGGFDQARWMQFRKEFEAHVVED